MRQIEIYTKDYCPYCKAAKTLLNQLGWSYTEYEISSDFRKREEMVRRSGRRTVPQLFIADEHIGGYDDFSAYIRHLSKLA
ncbi:glutaredoxin 3 [Amphritea balenae]|uniref:Glutaredoxin n=1 Tax=Amphritea balenae TaxID=452629 RepID=A0A3P1SN05_9GAMM|nr:glutaredoxin 3 [Amphritea balenae]RRC98546.1 glutaredoxin 3 [Amphritea balenae]GGK65412.1 glutaredoxin 3 [Amphritea balenae]